MAVTHCLTDRTAWRSGYPLVAAHLLLLLGVVPVQAQPARPDLAGMWSDPPATLEDAFCFFWCTDAAIDHLNALIDDPANDARPVIELYIEASMRQYDSYLRPRLTAAALAASGDGLADDPGFRDCEPWGFARQIFAPHQLQIVQGEDHVEMRYAEWDIRRTVYLDGRQRPADLPPGPMGFSIGHYEDDALVIETSGITANLAPWGPYGGVDKHSEQLRVVERYIRTDDGPRLLMTATLEDPWALLEPVVLKKVWSWAPEQEIFPYEDCERPNDYAGGTQP